MKKRTSFRRPSFPWRVLLVAVLFGGVGTLLGLMAAVFLGEASLCALVGALLGAMGGAAFEAWPATSRPGRDRETDGRRPHDGHECGLAPRGS